jgi:hypothetical protein
MGASARQRLFAGQRMGNNNFNFREIADGGRCPNHRVIRSSEAQYAKRASSMVGIARR